eukprot:TRINITY_DN20688_c0_g1_i2.p1 TRINITY_DN20688_c0_g1~~TRINITY_DN20688_c0_g1_i2.p1  ORF type:complete len:2370 (+),score=299.14 TRINITY_DN20688_c0_g1_i2:661-7110(+)
MQAAPHYRRIDVALPSLFSEVDTWSCLLESVAAFQLSTLRASDTRDLRVLWQELERVMVSPTDFERFLRALALSLLGRHALLLLLSHGAFECEHFLDAVQAACEAAGLHALVDEIRRAKPREMWAASLASAEHAEKREKSELFGFEEPKATDPLEKLAQLLETRRKAEEEAESAQHPDPKAAARAACFLIDREHASWESHARHGNRSDEGYREQTNDSSKFFSSISIESDSPTDDKRVQLRDLAWQQYRDRVDLWFDRRVCPILERLRHRASRCQGAFADAFSEIIVPVKSSVREQLCECCRSGNSLASADDFHNTSAKSPFSAQCSNPTLVRLLASDAQTVASGPSRKPESFGLYHPAEAESMSKDTYDQPCHVLLACTLRLQLVEVPRHALLCVRNIHASRAINTVSYQTLDSWQCMWVPLRLGVSALENAMRHAIPASSSKQLRELKVLYPRLALAPAGNAQSCVIVGVAASGMLRAFTQADEAFHLSLGSSQFDSLFYSGKDDAENDASNDFPVGVTPRQHSFWRKWRTVRPLSNHRNAQLMSYFASSSNWSKWSGTDALQSVSMHDPWGSGSTRQAVDAKHDVGFGVEMRFQRVGSPSTERARELPPGATLKPADMMPIEDVKALSQRLASRHLRALSRVATPRKPQQSKELTVLPQLAPPLPTGAPNALCDEKVAMSLSPRSVKKIRATAMDVRFQWSVSVAGGAAAPLAHDSESIPVSPDEGARASRIWEGTCSDVMAQLNGHILAAHVGQWVPVDREAMNMGVGFGAPSLQQGIRHQKVTPNGPVATNLLAPLPGAVRDNEDGLASQLPIDSGPRRKVCCNRCGHADVATLSLAQSMLLHIWRAPACLLCLSCGHTEAISKPAEEGDADRADAIDGDSVLEVCATLYVKPHAAVALQQLIWKVLRIPPEQVSVAAPTSEDSEFDGSAAPTEAIPRVAYISFSPGSASVVAAVAVSKGKRLGISKCRSAGPFVRDTRWVQTCLSVDSGLDVVFGETRPLHVNVAIASLDDRRMLPRRDNVCPLVLWAELAYVLSSRFDAVEWMHACAKIANIDKMLLTASVLMRFNITNLLKVAGVSTDKKAEYREHHAELHLHRVLVSSNKDIASVLRVALASSGVQSSYASVIDAGRQALRASFDHGLDGRPSQQSSADDVSAIMRELAYKTTKLQEAGADKGRMFRTLVRTRHALRKIQVERFLTDLQQRLLDGASVKESDMFVDLDFDPMDSGSEDEATEHFAARKGIAETFLITRVLGYARDYVHCAAIVEQALSCTLILLSAISTATTGAVGRRHGIPAQARYESLDQRLEVEVLSTGFLRTAVRAIYRHKTRPYVGLLAVQCLELLVNACVSPDLKSRMLAELSFSGERIAIMIAGAACFCDQGNLEAVQGCVRLLNLMFHSDASVSELGARTCEEVPSLWQRIPQDYEEKVASDLKSLVVFARNHWQLFPDVLQLLVSAIYEKSMCVALSREAVMPELRTWIVEIAEHPAKNAWFQPPSDSRGPGVSNISHRPFHAPSLSNARQVSAMLDTVAAKCSHQPRAGKTLIGATAQGFKAMQKRLQLESMITETLKKATRVTWFLLLCLSRAAISYVRHKVDHPLIRQCPSPFDTTQDDSVGAGTSLLVDGESSRFLLDVRKTFELCAFTLGREPRTLRFPIAADVITQLLLWDSEASAHLLHAIDALDLLLREFPSGDTDAVLLAVRTLLGSHSTFPVASVVLAESRAAENSFAEGLTERLVEPTHPLDADALPVDMSQARDNLAQSKEHFLNLYACFQARLSEPRVAHGILRIVGDLVRVDREGVIVAATLCSKGLIQDVVRCLDTYPHDLVVITAAMHVLIVLVEQSNLVKMTVTALISDRAFASVVAVAWYFKDSQVILGWAMSILDHVRERAVDVVVAMPPEDRGSSVLAQLKDVWKAHAASAPSSSDSPDERMETFGNRVRMACFTHCRTSCDIHDMLAPLREHIDDKEIVAMAVDNLVPEGEPEVAVGLCREILQSCGDFGSLLESMAHNEAKCGSPETSFRLARLGITCSRLAPGDQQFLEASGAAIAHALTLRTERWRYEEWRCLCELILALFFSPESQHILYKYEILYNLTSAWRMLTCSSDANLHEITARYCNEMYELMDLLQQSSNEADAQETSEF